VEIKMIQENDYRGWDEDYKTGIKWGPIADKLMKWKEAMDWAEKQGGRLPKQIELFNLFQFGPKEIQLRMKGKYFWSLPNEPEILGTNQIGLLYENVNNIIKSGIGNVICVKY